MYSSSRSYIVCDSPLSRIIWVYYVIETQMSFQTQIYVLKYAAVPSDRRWMQPLILTQSKCVGTAFLRQCDSVLHHANHRCRYYSLRSSRKRMNPYHIRHVLTRQASVSSRHKNKMSFSYVLQIIWNVKKKKKSYKCYETYYTLHFTEYGYCVYSAVTFLMHRATWEGQIDK